MKNPNEKIYNIHSIINANTTKMKDGSTWVRWSADRVKEGLQIRNLNIIADILTGR